MGGCPGDSHELSRSHQLEEVELSEDDCEYTLYRMPFLQQRVTNSKLFIPDLSEKPTSRNIY